MGVGGVGVCKSSTFSSSSFVLGNPKHCFHGIPKNSFRPLSALVTKQPGGSTDALSNWAYSQGPPHTKGTFARTLVNVGDLHRHYGECQEGSREYGVEGSPNFAKLRQSSHEGARMLPGTSWNLPDQRQGVSRKKTSAPQALKHGGAKLLEEWTRCPLPPKESSATSQQLTYFNFSVWVGPPKPSSFPNLFQKIGGELCQIRSGEPSWTIGALSL